MSNDKTLRSIDEWVSVVVLGLFMIYMFYPNALIGASAALLFIYWLGLDIYVSARLRSYPELIIDMFITALIIYAFYNPQFMNGALTITPLYIAFRVLRMVNV